MRLHECIRLAINHQLAKFHGHRSCQREYVSLLVYHRTTHHHIVKGSCDSIEGLVFHSFSASTLCSFKVTENKLDVCRGEDCMKKFWECLIDHTMKVINFKKGKMKLSTKEQQKSYENVKICYICKRNFEDKYLNNKKYCEFRNRCYYTGEYRGATHIAYVI